MAFKIDADPTFAASLTIVGQGRKQTLDVTFRAQTAKEYHSMLKDVADEKISAADAILKIIASWNADADLTAASIDRLDDQQPGAGWAILSGYGEALTVHREKNS